MVRFKAGTSLPLMLEMLKNREEELRIAVSEFDGEEMFLPGVMEAVLRRLRADIDRLKALISEGEKGFSIVVGVAGERQLVAPYYFECAIGPNEIPF